MSAIALIALAALASCRSAGVGVRPDFQGARVQTVIITPFYQRARFGQPAGQPEMTRALYQEEVARWLEASGFQVMRAAAFEQHMVQAGAWQDWQDGLWLRDALARYFEPGSTQITGAEITTIVRMRERGALPQGQLLFAEVVYQSQGICSRAPRARDRHASVEVHPSRRRSQPPYPCLVSHLHAKLVSRESGHTMWMNRHLVQHHVPEISAALLRRTIALVVDRVLRGRHGMERLR